MIEPMPKMGFEGKDTQAQASLGDDLWDLQAAAAKLSEFTAGRTFAEFEQSEVLQAVTASMLEIMHGALQRIARQAPEIAGRLALGPPSSPVTASDQWHFIQDDLPAVLANATVELEAWHEG